MPNGKMNAIEVEDAVVSEQWTLLPGSKLLSERMVEAAHGAGTGGNSHEFFSDFADFVGAGTADKHLGQGLRYLGFIPSVTLKHLCMELPLTISRH